MTDDGRQRNRVSVGARFIAPVMVQGITKGSFGERTLHKARKQSIAVGHVPRTGLNWIPRSSRGMTKRSVFLNCEPKTDSL